MYKLPTLILTLGILILGYPAQHSVKTIAPKHVISMKNMKFDPKIITINVGESITWVNHSKNIHNLVFPKLKIRSKFITRGKKLLFTFYKVGEFNYYCQPHKTMGMTGTVKVIDGNKKRNFSFNRVRN